MPATLTFTMTAPSIINAVLRAFDLLQALNRQPVSTLDMLYKQTGIPKPTIVRLLRTMETKGLVHKAPQYGAYQLTAEVTTLSSGYHSEPKIVEASSPLVDALTAKIKWPIAIAVCDGLAMVVRYSTIPSSPLSFLHSSINMRLSLASRAMGRAYLAFCEPDAQNALLQALSQSDTDEDAPARDRAAMRSVLDQVKTQGYALREPTVRPVSSTLAVPIFEKDRVIASMGLTWFSSVMSIEQAVTSYLADLQDVSHAITRKLLDLDAKRAAPGQRRNATPRKRSTG